MLSKSPEVEIEEQLKNYAHECGEEIKNILDYWSTVAVDNQNGGFYGKIDHENKVFPDAPKGSVMYSRILWAFSAAYAMDENPVYKTMAKRACDYLLENFIDREFGGVYWTVSSTGLPLDTKKQVYAQSFAVYALSEYHLAFGCEKALAQTIDIYRKILETSRDKDQGGYIEALARDFSEMDDIRLSLKDANEPKSMNTHLHVLEGFANLYRAFPDIDLKKYIEELIRIFLDRIVHPENAHLILFFGMDWTPKSVDYSYGHDIEAAWLIQESAEIIGNKELIDEVKEVSLKIAHAAEEGLDAKDGGMWYEYNPENQHLLREKHSWPQAEALVGYFNAYEISGNSDYLLKSLASWNFIKNHIKDQDLGEWVWGVYDDYSLMNKEDKAGMWKCPYHNSRACMEIIKRINKNENPEL